METKVKIVTTYVAQDGKEFSILEECEKHNAKLEENAKQDELEKRFEQLITGNRLTLPSVFDPYEESDFYLITINCDDDKQAVIAHRSTDEYFEDSYVKDYLTRDAVGIPYPIKLIYREDENAADVYPLEITRKDTIRFLYALDNKDGRD